MEMISLRKGIFDNGCKKKRNGVYINIVHYLVPGSLASICRPRRNINNVQVVTDREVNCINCLRTMEHRMGDWTPPPEPETPREILEEMVRLTRFIRDHGPEPSPKTWRKLLERANI